MASLKYVRTSHHGIAGGLSRQPCSGIPVVFSVVLDGWLLHNLVEAKFQIPITQGHQLKFPANYIHWYHVLLARTFEGLTSSHKLEAP